MSDVDKKIGQKSGGHVRSFNRNPEHHRKHEKHQGEPEYPACHKSVERAIEGKTWFPVFENHGPACYTGRFPVQRLDSRVMKSFPDLPAERTRRGEDLLRLRMHGRAHRSIPLFLFLSATF